MASSMKERFALMLLAASLVAQAASAVPLEEKVEKLIARTDKALARTVDKLDQGQDKVLAKAEKRNIAFCRYSPADYNFDHKVNDIDVQYFEFCFAAGIRGLGCRAADLDRNGNIGLGDLSLFADQRARSQSQQTSDICVAPPLVPTPGVSAEPTASTTGGSTGN